MYTCVVLQSGCDLGVAQSCLFFREKPLEDNGFGPGQLQNCCERRHANTPCSWRLSAGLHARLRQLAGRRARRVHAARVASTGRAAGANCSGFRTNARRVSLDRHYRRVAALRWDTLHCLRQAEHADPSREQRVLPHGFTGRDVVGRHRGRRHRQLRSRTVPHLGWPGRTEQRLCAGDGAGP